MARPSHKSNDGTTSRLTGAMEAQPLIGGIVVPITITLYFWSDGPNGGQECRILSSTSTYKKNNIRLGTL